MASTNEAPSASSSSCRKHKQSSGSFIEEVRSHIDEFLHASMEEHRSCLKNTLQKMFGISRRIAADKSSAPKESILSLQVTTTNKALD